MSGTEYEAQPITYSVLLPGTLNNNLVPNTKKFVLTLTSNRKDGPMMA